MGVVIVAGVVVGSGVGVGRAGVKVGCDVFVAVGSGVCVRVGSGVSVGAGVNVKVGAGVAVSGLDAFVAAKVAVGTVVEVDGKVAHPVSVKETTSAAIHPIRIDREGSRMSGTPSHLPCFVSHQLVYKRPYTGVQFLKLLTNRY